MILIIITAIAACIIGYFVQKNFLTPKDDGLSQDNAKSSKTTKVISTRGNVTSVRSSKSNYETVSADSRSKKSVEKSKKEVDPTLVTAKSVRSSRLTKFKVDSTQDDGIIDNKSRKESKTEPDATQEEAVVESKKPIPTSDESSRDLQTLIIPPPVNDKPSSDVKTAKEVNGSQRENAGTALNPTPSEALRGELNMLPDSTAKQASPRPPDSNNLEEVKPDPATAKALEKEKEKEEKEKVSSADESGKKKKKKSKEEKKKNKSRSKNSSEKKGKKKKDQAVESK